MFKRNCPLCAKELSHTSIKNRNIAERKQRPCRTCSDSFRKGKPNLKLRGVPKSEEHRRKQSEVLKGRFVGDKNPFFGMTHTEETKEKLRNMDRSYTQTAEHREKMSKRFDGKKHPRLGTNTYEQWVKRYGVEEADRRDKVFRKKLSDSNSGSGNPMYGKPSPKGSGNGWSGWYKGWYFRSLNELSFMVNYIERFHLTWVSAEADRFKIKYVHPLGQQRNYFPDFLIEGKYLVECKPKKLWNTPDNSCKKSAAIDFCKDHGYSYLQIDTELISYDDFDKLIDLGLVVLIERYKIKYDKYKENRLCKSK